MPLWESVTDRLAVLKVLRPAELKKLAGQRLSTIVLGEISRARRRVTELEKRYPSAPAKEIAQRLVEHKKTLAGMVGGVTGMFGLAAAPADLVVTSWLELGLLVDIATVYKVNLKADSARQELLDLYGYSTGIGPLKRIGPRVLGRLATTLMERGGLKVFGRAVPVVAAPVSAYYNNQHMQTLGDEAVRHYEGFTKARRKTKDARGPRQST
jgi:hypothetical protein